MSPVGSGMRSVFYVYSTVIKLEKKTNKYRILILPCCPHGSWTNTLFFINKYTSKISISKYSKLIIYHQFVGSF